MVKVKKLPKETVQGLIQRFSQKVKKSGILLEARKRQFKKRAKSRYLKKISALRRIEKKKEHSFSR